MISSIEQSLKDKIRQIAKEQNRLFNDVWTKLILERFLVRLSRSQYTDKLIFKGGMLLAEYLKVGRETLDLDFLLTGVPGERELLEQAVWEIVKMDLRDGFEFSSVQIKEVRHIQTHYPGFEISLVAVCGKTETPFSLDIGIGDIVQGRALEVGLSRTSKGPLFEEEVTLQAYPIESIFAEKYETACFRGSENSRMKDYHDLWMMTQSPEVLDISNLKEAVVETFAHRGTPRELIPVYSGEEADKLQDHWNRHLRTLGETEVSALLPELFAEVVDDINSWIERHIR